MDEQEFLERFGMTREEYGNQYGVLEDPNMGKGSTLRQKAVDKAAGALQGLENVNKYIPVFNPMSNMDQYSAYKTARDFLGDADSSSIAESAGLVDFSLLQLPFAIQETKRAYDRGEKVEAGVGATIALVEMFPGMKLASAPLKGFLRNLGKKSMAKEAPVDLSRRKALGAIAAAPVAATALSSIPVGKVIDDVVPVIKNVVEPKTDPTVIGQEIFDQNDGLINISKELDFVKDLYKVATGKSISKEKLVEKELAQYLYWSENGNFYLERAVIKKGDEELPMYELLELGDSPEYQKIAKKHMGDADGYNYGQSGGSEEFTSRLFQAENPDSIAHDEEVYVDWIKSKGIQNTQYYKDLVKAGDAD